MRCEKGCFILFPSEIKNFSSVNYRLCRYDCLKKMSRIKLSPRKRPKAGRNNPVSIETATSTREMRPTIFRKLYMRGDLPVAMEHYGMGNKIFWKVRLVIKMYLGV